MYQICLSGIYFIAMSIRKKLSNTCRKEHMWRVVRLKKFVVSRKHSVKSACILNTLRQVKL